MLLLLLAPSFAQADPSPRKERLLLMDLGATLGADRELAALLQDIFVARLQKVDRYEIISNSDIARMLNVEQQKQLVGCDETSCLAEIGGALNARWLVTGNLSLLGGKQVLSLKLVDTQAARLDNQLAKELPDDDRALSEAVRVATYELFRLPVPPPQVEAKPWYASYWLWTGVGVVIGGTVGGYFLLRPAQVPDAGLGKAVLDAH